MPVRDVLGRVMLERDEHCAPDATLESLAALKPAFAQMGEQAGFDAVAQMKYPQVESIHHVHTAANSSGIVDGAAGVLIGSRRFGTKAGLKPRARIRAFTSIGSEPAIMLTGPALVTQKLLKRAGMSVNDIDLFEVNEAFASVVLRFMRAMDVPHDKVNVNGGAIAMGHPLGATGAVIAGHRARRARAPRPQHRAGHALRRRGHGHGHDHRARLNAPRTGTASCRSISPWPSTPTASP